MFGCAKEEDQGQEQAIVSLNSLYGDPINEYATMRILGSSGKKTLHILIDTDSSHNILSDRLHKFLY